MTTTPKLWKSQTQANATDGGDGQFDGQVAALPDGGYVVVWVDDSRTHNPFGDAIVGQRYDSAGNKVGGEVNLSHFSHVITSGQLIQPAVTVLANGNIAVAFDDSSSGDIYVRTFDSALNPVRQDDIELSATFSYDPSLTALADGSYVVSYTLGPGFVDTDIVARIVSATGTMSDPFDIHNNPFLSGPSELATLSNGNFVAVFQDETNGIPTNADILYRIFNNTGAPLTAAGFVPGGSDSQKLETDPDVAALRDGGFVVVWTSQSSEFGTPLTEIAASILSNTGATVSANIPVNGDNPVHLLGHVDHAGVVALADGGFVVSWDDYDAGFARAQRFDAVGHKIGSDVILEDISENNVAVWDRPEAALLPDGRIAFALGDISTGDYDVVTSIWDPRTPAQNFDGINQSDFAWQNTSDGQAAVWQLNGTSVTGGNVVGGNPGASWHLRGDGDFNADGRSDFLWQNDNGQAAVWLLNGTNVTGGGPISGNPGASWHVIDSGDFDGEGNDDILWQDNGGQAAIWLMNGTNLIGGGLVGASPGADWHIKASGDFNGDLKSDILWQNDSGQAAVWLLNGTSVIGGGLVGGNPGASWHLIDAGDFNGDNKSDVLWQNDNGQAAVWLLNGTTVTGGDLVGGNPGASWHVVGAGQFNNGDLKSDILWQHDSGQAAVWLLDGTNMIGGSMVGGNPGADWHLIA